MFYFCKCNSPNARYHNTNRYKNRLHSKSTGYSITYKFCSDYIIISISPYILLYCRVLFPISLSSFSVKPLKCSKVCSWNR